jgi:hypothetical protein
MLLERGKVGIGTIFVNEIENLTCQSFLATRLVKFGNVESFKIHPLNYDLYSALCFEMRGFNCNAHVSRSSP